MGKVAPKFRRAAPSAAARAVRTTGAPGSKARADVSRDRVLEAAARIFSERGYVGTTMREVARHVDMQAGSLYYHYRSKEDLIEAVLAQGMQGFSDAVRMAVAALPEQASFRERFNTAVLAHLRCLVEFGAYALASRRVLGQVPAHVRRRQVALQDAYGEFWLALLQSAFDNGELRPEVDLHLARTFLLGALNYALEWYKPQGRPMPEIAQQFSSMICQGIFKADPG